MGMFDTSVNYDAMPIGSVIQSPINLEKVTDGKWIALDGRDCNRSDYPELSPYFPAGVFTSTARTLAGAPANATIASDGTVFLCPSVAGTSPLQASADGISWSTSATWTGSIIAASIIVAGSRWVAAGSVGDFAAPQVANIGQSAGTICAKSAWTATTSGTTTTLTQGLAYSPTLGRTVLCKDGSLATASGLFYLNDGATAWSACNGGGTVNRTGVVWTGEKFISIGLGVISTAPNYITIQSSSDGITWADSSPNIPVGYGNGVNGYQIASDGNGTVVIKSAGNNADVIYAAVSKDHGATWKAVSINHSESKALGSGNASINSANSRLMFANGLFFWPTYASGVLGSFFVSKDGNTWHLVRNRYSSAAATQITAIAYKSGVYCAFFDAGTAAFTFTEDTSKFTLPARLHRTTSIQYGGTGEDTQYIKARK